MIESVVHLRTELAAYVLGKVEPFLDGKVGERIPRRSQIGKVAWGISEGTGRRRDKSARVKPCLHRANFCRSRTIGICRDRAWLIWIPQHVCMLRPAEKACPIDIGLNRNRRPLLERIDGR